MKESDIIIIGGGLAGLGCAQRLFERGLAFTLITENIGGRVSTSPDGRVNYGAYYLTEDCVQIMPYVEKVTRVRFTHAHFHDGSAHYHAFSPRAIKHIPAVIRLFLDLRNFRRYLLKFRKESLEHSCKELIEANPLIRKYYHQKAADYIRERNLEYFVREYLEQPLWASFFVDPREVPTALFLGSLQPLIVKSWSFVFHFNRLIAPFKERIAYDSVATVSRTGDHWTLTTTSEEAWRCRTLVMATPMNITNRLVRPQKIKGTIDVSFYHLRGVIRKPYDTSWYNFFSVKESTAISREPDGTYLYFYTGKDRISDFFSQWDVITHRTWQPALFFLGDEHINEHPEPGLFIASDHDVPGMEDAFITGQYVGKLVLEDVR